jgi:hypothetical protein
MAAPGVKYPAEWLPEPVGSQCDMLADGLLNPELPSRFVSARNNLRCEIKCTKRRSGATL